ncbi:MAG: hypothetical protein RBT64_02605 [Trichloromonas sp.]|jgi:hypothetical protein|nr:hypothetical protein [Trichloromonas sp.]
MAGRAIAIEGYRKVCFRILILLTACVCLLAPPGEALAEAPGPFEQVVTTAVPAGYGELLNLYSETLAKGASEGVKEISEKLNFYNQAIGRISGALDIGGKLYLGETKEAAISAGLLILGEAAGSEAGKAYLGAMGLTTLPVTTLITAFQIYRMSAAELEKSTIGVKLESLYGMIESDPKLKNRSREIGVGDPIPVTSESVEYLWRKVLLEDRWRDLFKTYVTDELGKDWPESSLWSRWAAPGNLNEEAELLGRRDEFKSCIAGLLKVLNNAAKVREQQYVMRKYADELQQKAGALSSSSVLQKYMTAVGMLPEVRDFVKNCPGRIQQGVNGNDLSPLIQVINNSKRYAVDVLAWIPSTGKLGTERESLLKELRSCHDQAWAARELLLDRREREERQKAESAQVTVWRASSFGFNLEFSNLQGAIEEEFAKTGSISAVNSQISQQIEAMNKFYKDQVASVQAEFDQAQQMRPIPPERNEEALKQFGVQLSAYRSIDQQALTLLREEVDAYVETLKGREKLIEEQLGSLVREIDATIHSYQTTKWGSGRSMGGIGELEETLAGYCGTFPASGYAGIGRYQFPKASFKRGDDISGFTGPYVSYLQSLSQKIGEEAMYISFCGGKAHLPTLIGSIDGLVALVERFSEKKAEIDVLEQKVLELETLLAETSMSANPRLLESWKRNLEEKQKPFVKKIKELIHQGESLKDSARAAQQSYQTDLGNMENDLAYIAQLRSTLGQLGPILKEFTPGYPGISISGRNGTFVLKPEVAAAYAGGQCSALIGRQVFMTEGDIRQARQGLDQKLAEARLVWMDQNYNLGLKEFVDMYIADRTGLARMSAPPHYTFIEWRGECRIITKDYFDTLKAELEKVDKVDIFFERNMEKAVRSDHLGLLSIPTRSQPVNNVNIDLANYPADGLNFLREVAANCWEDQTRAAVLGVIKVFEEKVAAYQSWTGGEAYFEQMKQRFSEVVGNLSSLEYDAQAAYNKDMHDPAVARLYQQAAAKEPAVMGFLSTAVGDPKLSPDRQGFFARLQKEYEQKFFFIRQWATISSRTPTKPVDEQLVKDFYARFEEAYEAKNDSRLMSLLSDGWEAGDGTTLFDVESYFRNMFTVFDEIQVDIRNLRVESMGSDQCRVRYELKITGRVYADGLVHQEQSDVVEELAGFDGGRVRIARTPQGRFWYSN